MCSVKLSSIEHIRERAFDETKKNYNRSPVNGFGVKIITFKDKCKTEECKKLFRMVSRSQLESHGY